jgi:hypothetical protein
MLLEIPLRNDSESYDFEIDLSGVTYNLLVNWNGRASEWTMAIREGGGLDLLVGAFPLSCGVNLLDRFARSDLPQGTLFLVDTNGDNEAPTFEGMGQRWRLLFEDLT